MEMRISKVVTLLIVFLALTVTLCRGQVLKKELSQFDDLRNGPKTPLDEVDRLGEQLLSKYADPKDRGQIYYKLAHIHAQSGVRRPKQIIAYAKKALECPLEPSQRAQLYIYWGDALYVAKDKEKTPFPVKRREAATVYLKGLRELISLKLPEKAPEPELFVVYHGPDPDGKRHKKMEEQWARRQHIGFLREMILHRRILQGQVVSLYSRRPLATEELKRLATDTLGEGEELDHLMSAVNDKIAKLPPEDRSSTNPVEAAAMPSTYLYIFLVLGVGAVIASALLLLSRWRCSSRGNVPGSSQ
jgi:hypothetical protein